ncbi:MAG TPA: site-2 protease family protein [Longimicrobiaceae bacterium]|nr:site-2 protease family protein [Longimicrobiaceae bacterium]
MSDLSLLASGTTCARCHTEMAPGMLACPGCGALLHSGELQRLAGEAEAAEAEGRLSDALRHWRAALELLPEDSRQHQAIDARIAALSERLARQGEAPRPAAAAGEAGAGKKAGIGAAALALLLKFKAVIFMVLTKAKFLFLGLSKLSTLGSMLLYAGYAWARFGWRLGLGWVACLYVHEMGHVWELRKYGIKASAPMFIPGLGAFVSLKQHPSSPRVDARIGLAGPVWGLGACVASALAYLATGAHVWLAIASFAAVVNLFNLFPIWQLDGGRAFNALSKRQRWVGLGFLVLFWAASHNGWLVLVICGALYRCFASAPEEEDWRALGTYVVLALCFALLSPGAIAGISTDVLSAGQ